MLIDSYDEKYSEHISHCKECKKFYEDLKAMRNYSARAVKVETPDHLTMNVKHEFNRIFGTGPAAKKQSIFSDIPLPIAVFAFSSFLILAGLLIYGILYLTNGSADIFAKAGKIILWHNIIMVLFVPLILDKYKKNVQLNNGEIACQIPQIKL